ncbi:MAG: PIN domain-containing protein [Parvibaculaceae bacterium]
MTAWMLDTNIASHVIKGDRTEIIARLVSLPMADIVVSSVTEGELLHGLAKRATIPGRYRNGSGDSFFRVDVLPWDHDVAQTYGDLRAACEAKGLD